MIYRNYLEEDMSADVAKTLAGAFVFLVTRHTWNKAENNTSELRWGTEWRATTVAAILGTQGRSR